MKSNQNRTYKQRGYIYARFSSDNQREVSIDDQIAAGKDFCEANGIQVAGCYSDYALTGRNDNRPDFQRMMREIDGCDIVVIWNTDRLHRNMFNAFKYLGELIGAGKDFASVTQPELNGESEVRLLLYSIYTWKDQRYSEDLSANVSRGMRGKAQRCEYLGYSKFGYGHEGNAITVNQDEAETVRKMHEMWQNGTTITGIARMLKDMGVSTSRGTDPGYNFVRSVLLDESYTGVYIWDDIRVEGGMPAIISRECYEKTLRRFQFRPRKKEARDYMLSGRLICGTCHEYMHGEKAKGGKAVYYCCKGKRKACQGNIRAEQLEDRVVEVVRGIFCDYENCKRVVDFVLDAQSEEEPRTDIEGYEKQLKDIARKRKNLVKAIAEGLPMEDAKETLDALSRQAATIERRIEEAQKMNAQLDADALYEILDAVRRGEFTDAEVLETFVSEVYLYNDCIAIVTNLDDSNTEPMEVFAALEKEEPAPFEKGTGNIQMVGHRNPNTYLCSCTVVVLSTAIAMIAPLRKAS